MQHRLGEALVLPWHPETIGCEDARVVVCVLSFKGGACRAPLMALDGHIGLQQLWDVLGDVGLEGIEDGSGRVVGDGNLSSC